ncbi:hypothetical protein LRS06_21945 [Hymenobacter sp. J193]|uniref:hypothetical protein n=1 Tax=Hymenobacter sp. J193 TaxID=2898429 RepID=UPI0021517C26|nr:hypothetical protein [Hymenobacter sp. J193]MCR5890394.1 hypothetical protein [Hymenobacter sp. J193]
METKLDLRMLDPTQDGEIGNFTYGTLHGSWLSIPAGCRCAATNLVAPAICLNDVYNEQLGNGQFAGFMQQIEAWAAAQSHDLMLLDVQQGLRNHLLSKRGFTPFPGSYHLLKKVGNHKNYQSRLEQLLA